MNNSCDKQLSKLLRKAIEPVRDPKLPKEMWTKTLLKLHKPGISVSLFDWVLAVIVLILCILVPETVIGLFYNL